MWYISEKRAVKIAQAIVAKHAPLILHDLGLSGRTEGIQNRIYIKDMVEGRIGVHGQLHYSTRRQTFSFTSSYVKDSAEVMLYIKPQRKWFKRVDVPELCETHTYILTDYKALWSRSYFEKKIISTLAHELRHFYQLKTGMTDLGFGGRVMYDMFYDTNDEEVDANEYAERYLESLSSK